MTKSMQPKITSNADDLEIIPKYIPKIKKSQAGINNPMYGKKHTAEAKRLQKKKNLRRVQDPNYKNPMAGTNLYTIWLEKYGKEEADIKYQEYLELLAETNAGYNNPRYGKVGARSSGTGWKGTYRGMYFRSLNELSFLVNYVDHFKLSVTLIGEEHGITYLDMYGNTRIYYADYLINDRFMVEIIGREKLNYTNVKLRKEAAEEYCRLKGLEYKQVEPIKVSYTQLKRLMQEFKVKFDEVTMKKWEAYLVKGEHKDILAT